MIATGGVIAAGSGVTLLARIQGNAGQPISRASLMSITWTLSNLTAGTVLTTGTFAVAASVLDSLQQADPRWRFDSAQQPGKDGLYGYNFLGTLGASNFPAVAPVAGAVPGQSGPRYQVDVVFQPVSGEPFRQIFAWTGGPVFG